MLNLALAKRLRAIRVKAGFTVQEVARILGVSPNTFFRWERGTSVPDADTLLRLCGLYHVRTIEELTGYRFEPPLLPNEMEAEYIRKYRGLPEPAQKAVKELLDREYEHARVARQL